MICDDEYQIIVKVKFTENAYSIITVRKQENETYTDLKVFSAQIQDTSLVCFKLYVCTYRIKCVTCPVKHEIELRCRLSYYR